ncbi:hypothetical protein RirG_130500 [Rhizophagus irregularis DAOM 197198w]|uniref:Uncharacterized protein n=1 Tax=Rhizophagus irregularis (strain DAOM 197198w) TaxID=1432141 RepID=A0A015J851_RHIIW|nr:hypothetical protein RirG_130500 [Rhizophagus irregularis DAOM 197198w]
MKQISFYQLQNYKIQIGYICNELGLSNPGVNHKNYFARVQYLSCFHFHRYLYKIVYAGLVLVRTI